MGREEKEKQPKSEEKVALVANFEDQRDGYKFAHVEVPDQRDFESNFYFTAYQKFAKEHNDSLGFDVENFFPKQFDKLVTLKPVALSPSKIVFEACKTAVQSVLDYLDQKNEHSLLFIRIVKANYRSDNLFFVTFEAKTKDSGEIEEYQSVIFRRLHHDEVTLHMFRKKGAVKGAVMYDCREKYHFDTIGGGKESDFSSKDAFVEYQKYVKEHDDREVHRMFRKNGAVKGAVKYECREKYRLDTIGGAKGSDFMTNDAFFEYWIYAKEHDDSEGFDIKHFPQQLDDLSMILKPLRKSNTSDFEDCKTAVQNILEYLKTKHEQNLKFVRIIKANCRSDVRFFVTFEAISTFRDGIEVYQSVFDHHCMHGKITLHMFRKKGAAKGALKYDWREGGYRFCRVGGAKESNFKSNDDFIAYQRYAKEHDDSEGFDIEHFIPPLSGGFFTILMPLRSNSSIFEECEMAVQNVLEYLSRKGEKHLELVRVIKANYSANYLFYVTFEAKPKEKGSEKTEEYQSVIFHSSIYDETCLQLFRKKGEKLKAKVVQAFSDEREEYEFYPVHKYDWWDFDTFEKFYDYEKYVKEHNESEGFDIKTFVGPYQGDSMLTLYPVQNTPLFEHCKEAVEIVLHHLNSMNEENLELVRVVKANFRDPYLFFITFKAKDKDLGKVNVYQSVIFHTGRVTELKLFRKKRRAKRTHQT